MHKNNDINSNSNNQSNLHDRPEIYAGSENEAVKAIFMQQNYAEKALLSSAEADNGFNAIFWRGRRR